MADLTGTPTFKETIRGIETSDPIHPTTVNPPLQDLLNNTKYLKEKALSHEEDYAYQIPAIVGTQIRIQRQSNTKRLYFYLSADLSGGNITISLDGGATSKPLQDIEGAALSSLDKGFVEVVDNTSFFTYAPKGGKNQGAVIITPSTVNQAIPKGTHNGLGYVVGSPNLISSNIKQGVNIFGKVGTLQPEDGHGMIIYDNPGNYTFVVPANVTEITIYATGGGGGGGGGGYYCGGGGGGGGGGRIYIERVSVTGGQLIPCVVGDGGAGGAGSGSGIGTAGSAGQDSSILSTTVTGGYPGQGGNPEQGAGGVGGESRAGIGQSPTIPSSYGTDGAKGISTGGGRGGQGLDCGYLFLAGSGVGGNGGSGGNKTSGDKTGKSGLKGGSGRIVIIW